MTAPSPTGSTDYRARRPALALLSELRESAFNHGYRLEHGEADGWFYFASDIGVPGEVGLAVAAGGGAWYLAVDHPGVAAELDASVAAPAPAGKIAAFGFAAQSALRDALHRTYDLAKSLPSLPLGEFEAEMLGLGQTEAAQWARRRIGQKVFRQALMVYWEGRCPLTGITEPALLRASHIIPWSECTSDAQRLDVHNGLLLSAHWDAAFDAGLVSFDDEGGLLVGEKLNSASLRVFSLEGLNRLTLRSGHFGNLAWHRNRYGF